MVDAAKYGKKHICFSCGCKFYDLNRPVVICPKCKTNQQENPKNGAAFDMAPEESFPNDDINDKLLPTDVDEIEVADNEEGLYFEEADLEEE